MVDSCFESQRQSGGVNLKWEKQLLQGNQQQKYGLKGVPGEVEIQGFYG